MSVFDKQILAGELTRRDLAFLLFKRKYQILGAFAATLMLVTASTYLVPRQYVASATVYVVRNLPPIAAAGPSTLNFVLDRKEVLNSEVDLITSRAVAEQVADILLASKPTAAARPPRTPPAPVRVLRAVGQTVSGFFLAIGLTDPPPGPRDGLIASLQSSIEAKPGVNSDFITVSGTAEDPAYAALIVNTFTKVYLERRLALFKRPGLEEFYDDQIQRVRAQLEQLNTRITALKTGSGVVSQDEQLRLKLQEMSGVNTELNRVQSETQELAERMAVLQARIDGQPDTVTSSRVLQRNPAIIELERKTVDLQAEKAAQLNRFQQDSPVIQEIDRSIERLAEAARREQATVVNTENEVQNTVRTTLVTDLYRTESDYRAKQARVRALQRQIAELAQQIHVVDNDATELRHLEAESASAGKIYATYVEQREAAKIATQTDPNVTNVQVIKHATAPASPRFPRAVIIAVGGVLGLFLGGVLAFVSELFSHTLNRREDVERELGLAVLAAVPDIRALQNPF